jgi:LPXTG-motif cell wall-anchored protein
LGLLQKTGISEARFFYITKRAVWAKRGGSDALYNGVLGGLNSKAEEDVFRLLIGKYSSITYGGEELKLATPPESFVVERYTTGGWYQQLIIARDNPEPTTVTLRKVDLADKELTGATIELKKADGTLVETWVSDGKAHEFTVSEGSYVFHEASAPEGYTIATDIPFSVDKDGVITVNGVQVSGDAPIVMVDDYDTTPDVPDTPDDKSFTFSKTDVAGKELAGATIQLQNEDGTVAETWVSDGTTHKFTVKPGTYTLVETAAPSGYTIATKITVVVGEDGKITANGTEVSGDAPIVMVDNYATVPYNPPTPTTYSFTFSKTDVAGKELAGATIQLQNEDGTVAETWVSDGTTHKFTVKPGTYTLVETAAPEGYTIATKITVVVDANGRITADGTEVRGTAPVVMVDDYAPAEDTPEDTPTPRDLPGDEFLELPKHEPGTSTEKITKLTETQDADQPKTGDSENLPLYLLMAMAAAGTLGVTLKRKKQH